jgi:tripartite-type tricarboxylate transporter receptor subunit TctC
MSNTHRRALLAALAISATGLATKAAAQEKVAAPEPVKRVKRRPQSAPATAPADSAPTAAAAATPDIGWPTQTVKIVVPYAPGGTTDIAARLLAQELAKTWRQAVIVENKAGAATQIGTDQVAKSKDNHTLLVTSGPFVINTALYPKLPYDNIKDFLPITALMRSGMVLVTNANSGLKSMADVVALGKTDNGLTIGSAGNGGVGHMSAELLADMQQLKLVHVPYRGASPAVLDLVGGQIPLLFESTPAVASFIAEGKLKVLAYTDRKRSKVFANVPTIAESGFDNYETVNWWGLFAPSGVGEQVANKIFFDTTRAIKKPEFAERFAKDGIEIGGISRESFGAFLAIEQIKWTKIIKARNIKPD